MYMRINYLTLKPGTKEALLKEANDFLHENDPEESGLLYILESFADDGSESIGITVWKDKEKFDASSQNWPNVMAGIAHLVEGEPRRVELELNATNLPDMPPAR